MIYWIKSLSLVKNSQGIWNSQSECFFSVVKCSYATLKLFTTSAPIEKTWGQI